MKTKLLLSSLLSLYFCLLSSQIPQGFNYQAVAINNSGAPIANTTLQVKIAILSDLVPGTLVWEELHSSVQTNAFGLFTLVIGSGVRQSGVSSFTDINWGATPLYLRSQIYYNSEWKNMGSAQLWTVPYAMIADDLSGSIKKLAVTGVTSSNEEALFEVKNKNGQTVFAVYNEGVRVYVSDGDVKGVKGGFAIGGFDDLKGTTQDYFIVNPDSIRAYINDTPAGKGVKGGFAIGGFDDSKALTQSYLKVSPDSIRLYVDNNPAVKGVKGGFAIGGFDDSKGTKQDLLTVSSDSTRIYVDNTPLTKGVKGGFAIGGFDGSKTNTGSFLNLTKDNYLIGQESGLKISSGLYNSFLGYQSGYNTTSGSKNYFIGYKAGYSNTSGKSNTFIGDSAGFKNTIGNYNSFIGNWTGYSNVNGYKNTFIGYRAGYNNSSGICNVFIGPDAGISNSTAWYNTFVGIGAGYHTTSGGFNSYYGINSGFAMTSGVNNAFYGSNSGYWFDGGSGNTFIGAEAGRGGPDNDPPDPAGNNNTVLGSFAGYYLENASNNVIVGADAGGTLRTGTGNVFIGNYAGYNETGSDKLYISNTNVNPPIIYGDFSSKKVGINTLTLNKTLNVGGDAEISGNLSAASVTAPLTGTVTGNVTGDVTGNVTGDVTGNVTGDVHGNINGLTMGIINMTANGIIVSTRSGQYDLYWDKTNSKITARNTNSNYSHVWWQGQQGATPVGGALALLPNTGSYDIITSLSTNSYGYEIHFGDADGGVGYCSVWIQYSMGRLVGHYIKY